jgi:sugar phosphate isomerase/epimerase
MPDRRTFLLTLLAPLARAAVAPDHVGCQTNAWKIDASKFSELMARVRDLKRLGFATFECNVRFVEEQFGNAAATRRQIEETGVRFYGPHTGLKWPLEQLMKYADGAAALGALHLALSGIGGMLNKDGTLKQDALAKKIETINRLGDHCHKAGLRLVYHNHAEEFSAGGAEIEQLLSRTNPESLSLLVDVGHAFRENSDVPAFFRRHHQRIDALHLRDMRAGKQVPMGQGDFNFAALAAAIRETGWSNWLTLEEENLNSEDNNYVESVLANGRRLIRQIFLV